MHALTLTLNISDVLDHLNFIEADRCLGHESIHLTNNSIYVTRPWNSPLIINQLPSMICKLLSVCNDAFKTALSTLLTTSSIERYLIEFEIPLTNNKQSNDQFSSLIKRENAELIKQINATPADLLIFGLETQTPNWTGYIYHYTHLENAISILKTRCLLTNNNYIRFTFRPLTSSQAASENLGCRKSSQQTSICPIPIFFCIKLQSI